MTRPKRLCAGAHALWDWLERRSLNQREAARLIGMDFQYLNHLLAGRRRAGRDTALLLQEKTGIGIAAWSSTLVEQNKVAVAAKAHKRAS